MPRRPRTIEAHLIHHVVHRGINRQRIFTDDLDRRRFLRIVSRELTKRNIFVWAFCLMDNHFHLLLYDAAGTISQALQVLLSAYTLSYNMRHGCEGALLRGRFYSVPVRDTGYLLEVQRYIHRNPLVANMVRSSGQYVWSSYHHYLQSVRDQLVEPRPVLALLQQCGITASFFPDWTDQKNDGLKQRAEELLAGAKGLPRLLSSSTDRSETAGDGDFGNITER